MTIRISWDNDAHTLLRYQFDAAWCWDDLYRAIDEGLKLAAGRFTEIDTIFDASVNFRLPSGNMLFHARRLLDFLPTQRGKVVIVAKLPLLRNVVGIINHVYRTNFLIAGTLDEARALLAQYRQPSALAPCDAPASQAASPAEMSPITPSGYPARCPLAGDGL